LKKLFVILALLSSPAVAAEDCNLDLSVNGLVCDFCARSIEALFKERADVSAVKVDLDNGKVAITAKPDNDLDDAMLKKIMTDAGYTLAGVKRSCS
jgi:copper chaperone CopZ